MRTLSRRSVATAVVGLGVALASTACGGETTSSVGPRPSPTGSPTATTSAQLTDADAAKAFFDAVVAGNEKAAARVATPAAVAVFDPWEPAPSYTFTMEDSGGVFYISSAGIPSRCVVADRKVQKCSAGATDAESAPAESPTAEPTTLESPSAEPTT